MKKIVLVLAAASLMLVGCGLFRKTSNAQCQNLWSQQTSGTSYATSPGEYEYLLMNSNWPPNSVGAYEKQCLEEGWTPYTGTLVCGENCLTRVPPGENK
jgi:hypothetical protein